MRKKLSETERRVLKSPLKEFIKNAPPKTK